MPLELGVLEGDGIGPEIVSSAVRVVSATEIPVEFTTLPVGWDALEKHGSTVPEVTVERLSELDAWFLGPCSSGKFPDGDPAEGNPSKALRKEFDLYSNFRPIRSYSDTGPKDMNVRFFRQNTEGMYADRNMYVGGGQFMPTEDVALSIRVITRKESRRIAEAAFEYADENDLSVTAVHKANVLQNAGGLFLEEVEKAAETYPHVELETHLVDSFAAELAVDPTRFEVVVTTNLFGDILSDEAAGIAGSLGLAPGLNYNNDDGFAMAQATHGTAPDIAGNGIANPTSMILSAALLLNWLGKRGADGARDVAADIESAVSETIEEGVKTVDLGGDATTEEFTNGVINRL